VGGGGGGKIKELKNIWELNYHITWVYSLRVFNDGFI